MNAIIVVVTSVGLIVGSLLAAVGLCCLLWWAFMRIHHPEWAPIGILVLIGLALTGNLPDSQLLQLALAYSVAAALPLWFEGRAWRRGHVIETPRKAHRPVRQ